MLQRVRELAVQYKNGTLSTSDQTAIQPRSTSSRARSSASARREFNGIKLLEAARAITFQVGAKDSETITVTTDSLGGSVGSTGVFSAGDGRSPRSTPRSQRVDARADVRRGAEPPRAHLNNLATYQENLTASESRIRDVDMASEMVKFTKLQILQQAGTSMLAQANQAPQWVFGSSASTRRNSVRATRATSGLTAGA